MRLFLTGAAGFIGSCLARAALARGWRALAVDKLTYAGRRENLAELEGAPDFSFEQADICDAERMQALMARFEPDAIANLAAETHVDRSITGPRAFVETNVLGVLTLLEAARAMLARRPPQGRDAFRFLQVSTDEVYGALPIGAGVFDERCPYDPRSPHAASKAGGDHLVRAFWRTLACRSSSRPARTITGRASFPRSSCR